MLQKGFYLKGIKQDLPNNKGGSDEYVKHYIVQVYDAETMENGKVYMRDPLIRSLFLKPGVLEVMPEGTPITFDLDSKMRRTNDGKDYEVVVPVLIRKAEKTPLSK